jgi:predicted ArsR family transcriptional regulator
MGEMTGAAVHRALADDRRERIVQELRGTRDGLDVQELARRLGLHQNTIRFHLGVLADAGLVSSQPAERSVPGRPRIVYRLRAEAAAAGTDEYRLLATILAGTVAGRTEGPSEAEAAGRAWGRYLVRRPEPLTRLSDAEATSQVVELLDQQGFAPDQGESQIRMRRCPFHDLAETQPHIVCSVHRGLLSGALDELGSELEVDGLDVFVEPDLCIARLRRRDAQRPSAPRTASS